MNNMKKRIFTLLPLALPVALSAAGLPKPADKLNVLLILSDDHSVPHVGCYGNKEIMTPNL
ncbi:MAG: hypothetical protein WCH86_08680, partial [Kiritimatiellales bacterium]